MFAKVFKWLSIFSFVFLFWASFSFHYSGVVLADYLLIDDFSGSTIDANIWSDYLNSGTINITDSVLSLRQGNSRKFPFVISKNHTLNSGEFVEIKYKLFDPSFGTGIVFYDSQLENGSIPLLSKTLIEIWPSGGGKIGVAIAALCDASELSCDRQYKWLRQYDADQEWHYARLERTNDVYKFILDNQELLVSRPSTKTIGSLWFGNPEVTNTNVTFTKLDIDYVRVGTIITASPTPTPTPTPTPEPTPEPLRPVIILPGLGASWDFGAILNGTAGTNWQIPSFVTLYKNLIDSLENVGYVEGDNLFVFGYDWRKGLNDLANDLSGYINGLIAAGRIGADDKIDFISHSYGGLVARTYGQRTGTGKIDKLVTAGSPHQGLIDAYGIWEGATIWKNVWWQRAALELQIKLNQQPGENRVATARRLAPGIKDTLPTFDFLKKNDVLISSNSLLQKNAILADLNMDVSTISPLLWANGGNGNQTDRFLKTADRSWLDKALGQWEDGKPIASPFETTDEGDGAVLALSSTNLFVNNALLAANHEQIIANQGSLEKIFEELGLDKTKVVVDTAIDSRKNVFIASLRSPGDLHVCDGAVCDENLGIYLPNEKLFFLPGYENQALTAIVNADGETGKYLLYIGEMNEGLANWVDQRGDLTGPTQIDSYQVTETDGDLFVVGDSETAAKSFDEDVNTLNGLIPNWDKKKLAIARSESQPLKKRIMAIRQLRELLSKQAVKAYKNNGSDKIEAVIDVWEDIDDLAETVIGSGNTTKAVVLNANVNQVEMYKTLADRLLKNSSSYYAGTFYNLFDKRLAEAKEIKTTKRDLSLDKTLSARYLLLTALGVR